MNTTIREAVKEDIDAVVTLFEETYDYHLDKGPGIFAAWRGVVDIKGNIAGILHDADATLLIALVNNVAVGVSHVCLEEMPRDTGLKHVKYAKIRDLAVAAPWRSRGIGGELVKASEQWALRRGLDCIQLMVWSFNSSAQSFYERNGFSYLAHIMWKPVT